MKKFSKGDRVRLLRLDGTLSEEGFTLYDLWGDDDSPRNASFMSSGIEHYTHTDLIRHADDTSPATVPDGGEWFIARGNNMGWGRSRKAAGAVNSMRQQGGKVTAYTVHRVSKWTMVDGMGSLSWPQGIEPVEVKRVDPPKRKAA
jgi:hypothetical protein